MSGPILCPAGLISGVAATVCVPSLAQYTVTTIAGFNQGYQDGIGTNARFYNPAAIAVDPQTGNIFVADQNNNALRLIDGVTHQVTTIAGNGQWMIDHNGQCPSCSDGIGTNNVVGNVLGVALDGRGGVVHIAANNGQLRRLALSGGQWVGSFIAGQQNSGCYAEGAGGSACFTCVNSIATMFNNGVPTYFLADTNNARIRMVTDGGVASTLAGSGSKGYSDGSGLAVMFNQPWGVCVDNNRSIILVADNNRIDNAGCIRAITTSRVVSTLAGSCSGTAGWRDGAGTNAQFRMPQGVAVDVSGNVFVSDYQNNRLRLISAAGNVTTIAGNGVSSAADGVGTLAQFFNPRGLFLDVSNNLIVADHSNHLIRKVTTQPPPEVLSSCSAGKYSPTPNQPCSVCPSGFFCPTGMHYPYRFAC